MSFDFAYWHPRSEFSMDSVFVFPHDLVKPFGPGILR